MNKAFLYEMLRTESVSGGEIPLQKKVAAYMREQGAEVETDLAGDVISSINSASPFRVLLCGHIDEIGFRVTHITDDGYLQVGKAGGIRLALAQGKRVTVLGRKRLTGVMGLLLRNGEVRTDIELTDLYIDCGFTSRAEAPPWPRARCAARLSTGRWRRPPGGWESPCSMPSPQALWAPMRISSTRRVRACP